MTEPRTRAVFSVERDRDVIVIIDLDGPVSVTNDAEAVVAAVMAKEKAAPPPRIVYRDTEGRWDGLRVQGGRFAGFVILGCSTRQAAVDLAKGRPIWL